MIIKKLQDQVDVEEAHVLPRKLSAIVGTWIKKKLITYIYVPEGNVLDKRIMKVSKVASVAHNEAAKVKRFEAIKSGVEHLKAMKQKMDQER